MPTREELNRFNGRAQALGEAATKGDLKAVRAMLAEEPALVTHTRPFSDACKAGQAEVVRALVEAGADVNTTGGSGPSGSQKPLLWTIRPLEWTAGHRRVLGVLLDLGADPSGGLEREVVTPLLAAAEWCHPEAVVQLFARGARVGFYEAVAIADLARVESAIAKHPGLPSAIRRCGVGFSANMGTSLHFAALSRLGNEDRTVGLRLAAIAEMLIGAGAPAGSTTIDGERIPGPIVNAARSGNVAVLRVLLRHGADPQDALAPAVHDGALAVLDVLADTPLDVDAIGDPKLGNTLLQEWIRYGRLRSAEWLLARGASVNRVDRQGWTALHYACSRGVSPEFVQKLLEHGGQIGARDLTGATPLDLARQRGQRRLVELLEANGATD